MMGNAQARAEEMKNMQQKNGGKKSATILIVEKYRRMKDRNREVETLAIDNLNKELRTA